MANSTIPLPAVTGACVRGFHMASDQSVLRVQTTENATFLIVFLRMASGDHGGYALQASIYGDTPSFKQLITLPVSPTIEKTTGSGHRTGFKINMNETGEKTGVVIGYGSFNVSTGTS